MAHEPIVSRLQVNLSWKAWLKPFFIHPSVTEAAKDNLTEVRKMKQKQQAAKEELAAKISSDQKVATLLNGIFHMLDRDKHGREQAAISFHSRNLAELRLLGGPNTFQRDVIIKDAWRIVCTIDDEALKAKLRALFAPLNVPEYNLCIAMGSLADSRLLETLDPIFASQSLDLEQLRSVVNGLSDKRLKADLNDLIGEYELINSEEAASRRITPVEKNEPPLSLSPAVNPSHILQGSFLKTYGLDGYESSSTELVDAQGNVYSYDRANRFYAPASVPFSLALMTFLGFPTRLHGKANQSFRTIVRNLFGGWDSLNNGNSESWFWWLNPTNYTFQGKRLWNVLLLPIKLVIFAVKVATIPLKFALNVLKLVTEFLPEAILNYSGFVFGWISSALLRLHYDDKSGWVKIIPGIIFALIFTVSASIHYAARLLALVGTALTSPEKSARSAWNYGRALNSRWGYVFGVIGAALSVALTATLWAVAFPLVFAEAVALVPALGAIVATIAQWPIVAGTLAYINGAAVFVAGTLPAAFSLVATALSTALGVAVSATVLAAATTVAFIVAPVVSIMTRVLDGLSNVWTKWEARSPLLITDMRKEEVSVLHLAIDSVKASLKSSPSARVLSYTVIVEKSMDDAEMTSRSVDDRADVESESKQPYYAQTPTDSAPGIAWEEPRGYEMV